MSVRDWRNLELEAEKNGEPVKEKKGERKRFEGGGRLKINITNPLKKKRDRKRI